jgi:hypothetical protein
MQAADAQLAHLLQRAFDLGVECAARVLFPPGSTAARHRASRSRRSQSVTAVGPVLTERGKVRVANFLISTGYHGDEPRGPSPERARERTMHSKDGSRYGTRRSSSCGSSSLSWASSASNTARACSSSASACTHDVHKRKSSALLLPEHNWRGQEDVEDASDVQLAA